MFSFFQGNHATNLIRHINNNHQTEAQILLNRTNNDDYDLSPPTSQIKRRKKQENNSFQKVMENCVKLVTIHGRPFSIFNDEAFKELIEMIQYDKEEIDQVINIHTVKMQVLMQSEKIKDIIRAEIKGRLICLKLDSATCMDRSFLGVNVQYIKDDEIILRTLAITEVNCRQTAFNLREILIKILDIYNISISQILSITTDNGANFKKMNKLISDSLDTESENEENTVTSELDISVTLFDDVTDDNDENQIDVTPFETVTVNKITSVMCAAHTLQLAVRDILREDDISDIVDVSRAIVRKLRTPNMRQLIKATSSKKPIMDCTTRWNSTHDMLLRLIELKKFCQSTADVNLLDDNQWNKIEDLVNSLAPAKKATLLLQEKLLLLSDFFIVWTNCYLECKQINTVVSNNLADKMKIREKQLMNHGLFGAALYMHPRISITLSTEQRQAAIAQLQSIWRRLLKAERDEEEEANESKVIEEDTHTQPIEKMLKEIERNCDRRTTINQQTMHLVTPILVDFGSSPRLNISENILNFWQTKKTCLPQLYQLAITVLAVPATQVSVERLFSSLKYILNPHRYNLTSEILQNILIIRSNKDLM